jgi:hypothetical protein
MRCEDETVDWVSNLRWLLDGLSSWLPVPLVGVAVGPLCDGYYGGSSGWWCVLVAQLELSWFPFRSVCVVNLFVKIVSSRVKK